jgi:predicted RNA-binding protein Jag
VSKDETIKKYMEKLHLSFEEALSLWQDEQEDNLPDMTPEQKAVAKEMAQADRKKETAPRKRERKPDKEKQDLIQYLALSLHNNDNVDEWTITNYEREIEFLYNGNKYRLTLSKPRKEKN